MLQNVEHRDGIESTIQFGVRRFQRIGDDGYAMLCRCNARWRNSAFDAESLPCFRQAGKEQASVAANIEHRDLRRVGMKSSKNPADLMPRHVLLWEIVHSVSRRVAIYLAELFTFEARVPLSQSTLEAAQKATHRHRATAHLGHGFRKGGARSKIRDAL